MSVKKLFEKFTPEELAEAYIFPVNLSPKQKKEADIQLRAAGKKSQSEMAANDRLISALQQLYFTRHKM